MTFYVNQSYKSTIFLIKLHDSLNKYEISIYKTKEQRPISVQSFETFLGGLLQFIQI